MPYSNEHAARVRDPGSFEPKSFRSKDLKDGVRLILGKLKAGNGSMVVQAYRFSVDKFTVEQAKKWLEDNKIKFIKFEPAQNVSEDATLEHVGVLGMKWGHRKSQSESGGSSDARKVARVEKSWNKVKNKPISKSLIKDRQRATMITTAVLAAYFLVPPMIHGVRVAAAVGVPLGKLKIKDFMTSKKFEKYGGFDPKKVVNSTMWDAPLRPIATKLLTGGA